MVAIARIGWTYRRFQHEGGWRGVMGWGGWGHWPMKFQRELVVGVTDELQSLRVRKSVCASSVDGANVISDFDPLVACFAVGINLQGPQRESSVRITVRQLHPASNQTGAPWECDRTASSDEHRGGIIADNYTLKSCFAVHLRECFLQRNKIQ